jgi:hypothetical protein
MLGGRPVAQFDGYTYRYILTDALGSVLPMFDNIAGSAQLLGNQWYGLIALHIFPSSHRARHHRRARSC